MNLKLKEQLQGDKAMPHTGFGLQEFLIDTYLNQPIDIHDLWTQAREHHVSIPEELGIEDQAYIQEIKEDCEDFLLVYPQPTGTLLEDLIECVYTSYPLETR